MSQKKGGTDRDRQLRKELPLVAHEWTLDELFTFYKLDPKLGLSTTQVKEQREQWGFNR